MLRHILPSATFLHTRPPHFLDGKLASGPDGGSRGGDLALELGQRARRLDGRQRLASLSRGLQNSAARLRADVGVATILDQPAGAAAGERHALAAGRHFSAPKEQ